MDTYTQYEEEHRKLPRVWSVVCGKRLLDGTGSVERFQDNLYNSAEAAELEAKWRRQAGDKRAHVVEVGRLHSFLASRLRWWGDQDIPTE